MRHDHNDRRRAEERDKLLAGVDDFLAKLMRPDNPLKQSTELQRKYAREWYRRKRSKQQRVEREGFGDVELSPQGVVRELA